MTLLAIPVAAGAQVESESYDHTVESRRLDPPLKFDHLLEGLPQSHIIAITQDASGYLWFGTQEGLARYDGYDLEIFTPSDARESSISSGWVTDLLVDSEGRLWVATGDAGVNLYDPLTETFTHFGADEGVGAGGVAALHQAGDAIWVLRGEGGIRAIDAKSLEVDDLGGQFEGFYTAIDSAGGYVWLGTAHDGVYQVDLDTLESQALEEYGVELPSWEITDVLVAQDGDVWIGTAETGASRFDPDNASLETYQSRFEEGSLSSDFIEFVFEDRGGTIWIGTRNGLNQLRADDTFTVYKESPTVPTSISYSRVTSAFQDEGGVIWIGTFARGLSKFDPLRLKFDHYHTGKTALAFAEAAGDSWVGTYTGGLWRIDRDSGRAKIYSELVSEDGYPIRLNTTWITDITPDSDGILWITTEGQGLVRFDPETERATHFSTTTRGDFPSDNLWKIEEDSTGMLWLASLDAGVFSYDPARDQVIIYDDAIRMPSARIFTFELDEQQPGVLWIGTADAGLVRFDSRQLEAEHFDAETLGNSGIYSILQDEEALWLGTHAGLVRFDPNTEERTIYGPDVIGSNNVYGVLQQDGDRRLWLTTNGAGLVAFDPETESLERYTSADGLSSDEFSQGGCYQNDEGEMYVGGLDGFNIFRPDEIEPDAYLPPLVVTRYLVDNTPVPLGADGVDLEWGDTMFSFEFAALAFAAPSRNDYQYMLEGFDEEWRSVDASRRFATYTNLDGGDYTFKLRGSNRHGAWTETALDVPVSVAPPPWQSWWAYVLYGLSAVGAFLAYRRYNQQKVARLEQMNRLEAVERDLELTGAVQNGFLPAQNQVEDERVRIYGFYRAAEACGGDWWWHEEPAPGIFHVLVGDVTGHGPGPAMVTAAVGTAFRVQSAAQNRPITEKIDVLNREVLLSGQGKYHMTLAALEVDQRDGSFTFYSAGSTPLLRLKSEGRARAMPCRGTPLGSSGFELGAVTGQLEPGERILMFTDGIPEIPISGDRLLGMRRFSRMFEQTREFGLEEAVTRIAAGADQLRGNGPQDDDWTLVVVEWG